MGTQADLTAAEVRWLSPLPLWTGVLGGPMAWAADLTARYALVKWSCAYQWTGPLHLLSVAALTATAAAGLVAAMALQHSQGSTGGGDPIERARFMAVLGLSTSAFFAVAIVALDIPVWVLDVCS